MLTSYSKADPASLLILLVDKYSFESERSIFLLHSGFHDTYQVTTSSGSYILRVYRHDWKSRQDIEGELALLSLLHAEGVAVSYPLLDKKGQSMQSLPYPEGERHAVLFSYAGGTPLQALDVYTANLFGRDLATLHTKTHHLQQAGLSKTYTPDRLFQNTKNALARRFGTADTVLDVFAKTERSFLDKIRSYDLGSLAKGVCHGDPHVENCFIDHNQKLTFFDFDFCGNGYLLYDLGSFYHYEKQQPAVKEAFLEGYQDIWPLSEQEVGLIPYFEVLMRIFHLGARIMHQDGIKNALWQADQINSTIDNISTQIHQLT